MDFIENIEVLVESRVNVGKEVWHIDFYGIGRN